MNKSTTNPNREEPSSGDSIESWQVDQSSPLWPVILGTVSINKPHNISPSIGKQSTIKFKKKECLHSILYLTVTRPMWPTRILSTDPIFPLQLANKLPGLADWLLLSSGGCWKPAPGQGGPEELLQLQSPGGVNVYVCVWRWMCERGGWWGLKVCRWG